MYMMGAIQVKTLLMLTSQLSGYPIPTDVPLPEIKVMTDAEMAKEACDGDLLCPVIGFFQHPEDADDHKEHIGIAIEDGFDLNATAIHELTHWLQYHNWPQPHDRRCPREFLREFEAYEAGMRYSVTYQHAVPPKDGISFPGTTCPYTEKPWATYSGH